MRLKSGKKKMSLENMSKNLARCKSERIDDSKVDAKGNETKTTEISSPEREDNKTDKNIVIKKSNLLIHKLKRSDFDLDTIIIWVGNGGIHLTAIKCKECTVVKECCDNNCVNGVLFREIYANTRKEVKDGEDDENWCWRRYEK